MNRLKRYGGWKSSEIFFQQFSDDNSKATGIFETMRTSDTCRIFRQLQFCIWTRSSKMDEKGAILTWWFETIIHSFYPIIFRNIYCICTFFLFCCWLPTIASKFYRLYQYSMERGSPPPCPPPVGISLLIGLIVPIFEGNKSVRILWVIHDEKKLKNHIHAFWSN